MLAYFRPSESDGAKPVPEFKFRQAAGRAELVRGVRGPLIKDFYRGWTQFVKLAREWRADLVLLDGRQVRCGNGGASWRGVAGRSWCGVWCVVCGVWRRGGAERVVCGVWRVACVHRK